jgi:hypothetical protein
MFQGDVSGPALPAEIIEREGDIADLRVQTNHGDLIAYGVEVVSGPYAGGPYKCWVPTDA